jgi:peptide/nickel transport system substrate-binding protein
MLRPRTASVALVTVLLGVWGPGCARERAAKARVLRVAARADVLGFFPEGAKASDGYTFQVNAEVVEGLVRFDRNLRVQPALADHWETPDERTYVFHLRPGLRFSDGRPLTAEDVAASLTAARNWGTRDALQAIDSARALDAEQVEVRTRQPYLLLLQSLHWGFVLPRDEIARRPTRTIGSGPFMLRERHPGKDFTLDRNPHYHGRAPDFDSVVFTIVADDKQRLGRLLSGEADVADQIPPERIAALRARGDVQVFAGPGLRVLYLGLRVDRPPFSDARVREAVALALDRDELRSRALMGLGQPAFQLLPGTIVGYDPSLPPELTDRARARALLASSRHARLRVRLDGPRNRYTNDTLILAELARQLGEVGIEAEVNALDKAAFYALIDAGASDAHLVGWACRSGQGSDLLEGMLHSRSEHLGTWNSFGLSDPRLDAMIEDSGRTHDQLTWSLALRKAARRAFESRAAIPLVVQPEALAFRRGLRWDPSIDYSLWLEDVHEQ